MSVMISCEVGGTRFPTPVAPSPLADPARDLGLASGVSEAVGGIPATASSDSPARYVALRMSQQLLAPLITNEYSMEWIDVTRSLHHRALFPPRTRSLPAQDRQRLIDQIHTPYRERIRTGIKKLFSQYSYVIHLSIRSFPLRKAGKIRRADVGLLYDPSKEAEVDFCLDWIDEMYEAIPMLRVRRNYPRRGTTDSITKSMRAEFSARNYLGIEVLLNRAWAGRPVAVRDAVIDQMCGCLQEVASWSNSDAA